MGIWQVTLFVSMSTAKFELESFATVDLLAIEISDL